MSTTILQPLHAMRHTSPTSSRSHTTQPQCRARAALVARRLLLAAALLLAGTIQPQALCADDVSADALAALGDKDFAVREAATRQLLNDDTLTPGAAARAYQKATTPEQRHRLLDIAMHHYVRKRREAIRANQPFGALGLTHGPVPAEQLPQLNQPAVRVRNTLPGFPAHAAFHVGDLIVAIQGQPIFGSADEISRQFANAIQVLPAGRTATFTIYRDGKRRDVEMKLATRESLEELYRPEGLREPYLAEWQQFRDENLK